jgi:putative toxin-antitoxin system antitoxin component (TIGR02293 family)
MKTINLESILTESLIPPEVLEEDGAFIQASRLGISGTILQPTIKVLGVRDLIISLLNTDKTNLSKFYHQEHLSPTVSEAILDTLKVFKLAFSVYDQDTKTALKWFNTQIPALSGQVPIDLLDTFKGRELVKDCLMVMEYGDFT